MTAPVSLTSARCNNSSSSNNTNNGSSSSSNGGSNINNINGSNVSSSSSNGSGSSNLGAEWEAVECSLPVKLDRKRQQQQRFHQQQQPQQQQGLQSWTAVAVAMEIIPISPGGQSGEGNENKATSAERSEAEGTVVVEREERPVGDLNIRVRVQGGGKRLVLTVPSASSRSSEGGPA